MGNGTSVTEWDCATCGKHCRRPPTKGQRPKYCSDRCRDNRRHIVCAGCGESATTWRGGKFCSKLCQRFHLYGPASCPWSPPPSKAIVVWEPPTPKEPSPRLWVAGSCAWCGGEFVAQSDAGIARYCSHRCIRKKNKARRRGLERGATGTYTWAEVTRKWIDIGKRCWYCQEPKRNDELEPDHVVPLSRGGSNSIVNVVPACAECNRSKGSLLVAEWRAKLAAA